MRPKPSNAYEVEAVALKLGFVRRHGKGAHRQYIREDGKRVTVGFHPGDIAIGTLQNIIRQLGISVEEFNEMV